MESGKKALLVHGYVREKERKLALSMHVIIDIIELILKFFPMITFGFGEFQEGLFKVSDDKMTLKIMKKKVYDYEPCEGAMIYADIQQDEGLSQGAYVWSIKLIPRNWKSKYIFIKEASKIFS